MTEGTEGTEGFDSTCASEGTLRVTGSLSEIVSSAGAEIERLGDDVASLKARLADVMKERDDALAEVARLEWSRRCCPPVTVRTMGQDLARMVRVELAANWDKEKESMSIDLIIYPRT